MTRHFQKHIDELKEKVLFVGSLVEKAIAKAITALVHRDRVLAQQVIDADDEIDQLEIDVEQDVLNILALHQPVATDLRFVVAVLKINNDLERMGDLACNIAKRVVFLVDCDRFELPSGFRTMSAKAQDMVKRSLDALVGRDAVLAQQVRDADDEVDALKRSISEAIEQQIAMHPDRTESLVRLLSVCRHLERLADMATNVAEEVIYMVQGAIVRHQRVG
jgi:phosphate transport system protein